MEVPHSALLVGHFSWISPLRPFRRSAGRGLVPRRGLCVRSPGGRGRAPPLPDEKAMSIGSGPLVELQIGDVVIVASFSSKAWEETWSSNGSLNYYGVKDPEIDRILAAALERDGPAEAERAV